MEARSLKQIRAFGTLGIPLPKKLSRCSHLPLLRTFPNLSTLTLSKNFSVPLCKIIAAALPSLGRLRTYLIKL
jgi:hypothetical protein